VSVEYVPRGNPENIDSLIFPHDGIKITAVYPCSPLAPGSSYRPVEG